MYRYWAGIDPGLTGAIAVMKEPIKNLNNNIC